MSVSINLDHSAATRPSSAVIDAMTDVLNQAGNPSSPSGPGVRAKQRVDRSRGQVAALIGAAAEEIFFTSCGTESNNWAVRGLFTANKRQGRHVIISSIEHPSVSLAARRLELEGASATTLPVDQDGLISSATLQEAMQPDTVLVSIMLANGEVGTIEPIRALVAIAHHARVLFHTDAVAAVGRIPVDVKTLGVDALSLAADQFGGPQGAAALFVRDGVRILPLLEGGGQERGGRSGTEAVAAIVGMGAAAEGVGQQLPNHIERISRLRDRLRDGLQQRIDGLRFSGSWTARLPHNLHVGVDSVSSESLVLGLDQAGIVVGLGSACNSKAMRPSHVLKAMRLSDEQASGALVMTLGEETTEQEIDRALEILPEVVHRLRRVTALTSR